MPIDTLDNFVAAVKGTNKEGPVIRHTKPDPLNRIDYSSYRTHSKTEVIRINREASALAEQWLRHNGTPARAEAIAQSLKDEGWTAFPYLRPTPKVFLGSPERTLYRVMQARPRTFRLLPGSRWSLIEWDNRDESKPVHSGGPKPADIDFDDPITPLR